MKIDKFKGILPNLGNTNNPEPSLYTFIYNYYRKFFSEDEAKELVQRYIKEWTAGFELVNRSRVEVIQAPDRPYLEISKNDWTQLFIAGGISNCPDWQTPLVAELVTQLYAFPLIIYNPRRDNFDMSKQEESINQITWEYDALNYSDIVLFWFPKETLCPITLLELGKMLLQKDKTIFIGVEPEYQRKLDIEVQTKLERPEIQIVNSIQQLTTQVLLHIGN